MFLRVYLYFIVCGFAFSLDYHGYKIYEVKPKTDEQSHKLHEISQYDEFDALHLPRHNIKRSAHIMVSPEYQPNFLSNLTKYNLDYDILVHDVNKSLAQNGVDTVRQSKSRASTINFYEFHRYAAINAYMERLAQDFPKNVTIRTYGTSYERRDIKGILINNGDGKSNKKVVFVDAGIHAREWIAPAAALYIIYQLVENMKANADLLKDYDWLVLPLVNPDGYEYSHTTDRMWRKTRSRQRFCRGTDGNRNFDFHWGEVGASSWECSETYKGPNAFSEPETQTVRSIMMSLKGRGKFYLSLHAYGNYLLYPWGWTSALPSNYKDLDEIAAVGAQAIRNATGGRFTYGSSTNVLYAAAGGSDDYALAKADFPISITMELQRGGSGFNPTTSQIRKFVEEAWVGIKAMARRVAAKY